MLRIIIVLLVHGIILLPMQWYAIRAIRKDVIQTRGAFSRRGLVYIILILVAANYAVLCLTLFGTPFNPHDFLGRQFLAIAYFSYLLLVAGFCISFVGLKALGRAMRLLRRFFRKPKPVRDTGRLRESPRPIDEKVFAEKERGVISEKPEAVPQGSDTYPSVHEAKQLPQIHLHDISRRSFLRWAGAAGMAASAGAMGYGLSEAYQSPVINEFELSHPSLYGLQKRVSFIQVTDLHFSWFFGPTELERLVERLNSIEGHAVVFTGDVFHSRYTPVESSEPILRKLVPRQYGNYVIMGNHERYVRTERSLASFRRSNLTHLGDKWISFEDQGAAIHLGGLDDVLADWVPTPESQIFRTLMDGSPSGPGMRILLCHRPSILPLAAYGRIDLVLAGHTHGGQMIIPWPERPRGLTAAGLLSPYTHGWYKKFGCRMYLNRGAGLVFFPWRINCPPEIGVFHLVAPSHKKGEERVSTVRRIGGSS
ncbi:MAG: metallophosphoesterase [Desulfomonile tiedjei]|nr:metallophosphoesterase [Desulfomonile tiedjei]